MRDDMVTRTKYAAVLIGAVLASAPVMAQEPLWSSQLQAEFETVSRAFAQPDSASDRLAAMPDAIQALEAHSAEPGALLMRDMIASQFTAEQALRRSEATLNELAVSETLTASLAERRFVDLVTSVATIAEEGVILPSTALRITEVIARYDETIGVASGRTFDDALSALIEDPERRGRVQAGLDDIQRQAEEFADRDDIAAAEERTVADFSREFLNRIPSQAGPVFGSPAPVVFGDAVAWTNDMAVNTTDGMNLVADGIATGQVDSRRLQQITDRFNALRRGPWGGHTARGVMRRWCNRIAPASDDCARIFDALIAYVSDEDGVSGWTSSDGDDSLRVEDDVLWVSDLTDDWLTVTAPSRYHGDWSGMSVIVLDIMGPPLEIDYPLLLALESGDNTALFEFSVGSVASAEWRTLSAPLVPSRWVVQGDWPELIRNITDFKIRIDLHHGRRDDVARLRDVGPAR